MRKLMFLMLLLSGLSLVACGGDDDKGGNSGDDGADGDDGDGDTSDDTEETTDPIGDGADSDGNDGIDIPDAGSGGDDGEEVVSTCPDELKDDLAMIDPYYGYDGTASMPACPDTVDMKCPRPFSQADLMACQTMCAMNQDCYTEENCPGLNAFDACANAEIIKCSGSSATGQCRIQLENFLCCSSASGCPNDDSDEASACIDEKCGGELSAIQGCIGADTACTMNQGILATCLGTDEVPPTDPGTGDGMSTITSAHTVKQLRHSLQSLRASH